MRSLVRVVVVLALGAGLVLGARQLPDLRYRAAGVTADAAGTGVAGSSTANPVTRSGLVCPGPETVGVKGVDAKTAVAPTTARVAALPSDRLPAALGTTATTSGGGAVEASVIGGSGTAAALGFASLVAPGTA